MDKELKVNVRRLPMDKIMPAAYNPRITTEKGMRHLTASLERFGYVDPIIVNERTMRIIGGHQRFAVLARQGTEEVDVICMNMTEEREKALNIALNKTGEHFEWDVEKLNMLLGEMDDHSLDSIGFVSDDVDGLDLDDFYDDAAEVEEAIEGDVRKNRGKYIFCPKCMAVVARTDEEEEDANTSSN